jgi:hypothetical protein
MSQSFESFRIDHVYREQNREADALVNEAIDETSSRQTSHSSSPELVTPIARSEPRKLRARYCAGLLHPHEPLDLPENAEVEILLRLIGKN